MQTIEMEDRATYLSTMLTQEMLKASCKRNFKEGQKLTLIFANDRSDHDKKVKAKLIKFYPNYVHVRLSDYDTQGMTYIDFAKAVRRGLNDTKRIKPIPKSDKRNRRTRG